MDKIRIHISFSVLLLIGILFPGTHAFAQLKLNTRIDSSDILIGDWIKYSIEIQHDQKTELLWPAIPDSMGSFEVISRSDIDSSGEGNMRIKKQLITLTHFDSGMQVIPSLKFRYRKSPDTAYKLLETDTFMVHVSTPVVDTSQAIKPIKDPLKVPVSFAELLPYLAILLFIILLILAYLYYQSIKNNKAFLGIKPKPPIPPHIKATKLLNELEEAKLWQKGEIKLYHIKLTEIIRTYIEERFDIPAVESTTPEILAFLKDLLDQDELVQKMKGFLELSDLVKFAKYTPLPDENKKCLNISFEFIEITKPQSGETGTSG